MKNIPKPSYLEHAIYYESLITLVNEKESVLIQLKNNAKSIVALLLTLSVHDLTTPYSIDKWTIKDIVMHLIDMERVFLYRAMRFARNDKTAQPFFDENEFAKQANATIIPTKKLLLENKNTRQAVLAFFNNQTTASLKRTGIAGNTSTSVRACAWIICGHEIHHFNIIKEKYLQLPLQYGKNIYLPTII